MRDFPPKKINKSAYKFEACSKTKRAINSRYLCFRNKTSNNEFHQQLFEE